MRDLPPGLADELIAGWVEDGRRSVRTPAAPRTPPRADQRRAAPKHDPPRIRTLGEILDDPVAMAEPEEVVRRLAYKARSTLFAGREKLGKSTLVAAAIGAASGEGRRFLDGVAGPAEVLLLALEEHAGDVARRLRAFGADRYAVRIIDALDHALDQLAAVVLDLRPDLIVVDTLPALVERLGLDPGRSSDWTPVMAKITRLARATGAAIVLLHHANKSDGRYRDSTAIGAGVDVILEMSEDPSDSAVRKLRARGRVPVRDFSVRYVVEGDRPYFELTGIELPLETRVLAAVEANPGGSTRVIRNEVSGQASRVQHALAQLERAGHIVDRGSERGSRWHRVTGSHEHPHGTATEPVGNHPGNRLSENGAQVVPEGGGGVRSTPAPGTAPEPQPELDADLDQALGGVA